MCEDLKDQLIKELTEKLESILDKKVDDIVKSINFRVEHMSQVTNSGIQLAGAPEFRQGRVIGANLIPAGQDANGWKLEAFFIIHYDDNSMGVVPASMCRPVLI